MKKMCEHNVHTALSGRAPLNVRRERINGRTVDGGGVAQEGDRVGERDLELLQQELRDEGRQPSSVEVAHEGLQRDRRWWILKSESVKRNEKISNETTHP